MVPPCFGSNSAAALTYAVTDAPVSPTYAIAFRPDASRTTSTARFRVGLAASAPFAVGAVTAYSSRSQAKLTAVMFASEKCYVNSELGQEFSAI